MSPKRPSGIARETTHGRALRSKMECVTCHNGTATMATNRNPIDITRIKDFPIYDPDARVLRVHGKVGVYHVYRAINPETGKLSVQHVRIGIIHEGRFYTVAEYARRFKRNGEPRLATPRDAIQGELALDLSLDKPRHALDAIPQTRREHYEALFQDGNPKDLKEVLALAQEYANFLNNKLDLD